MEMGGRDMPVDLLLLSLLIVLPSSFRVMLTILDDIEKEWTWDDE